MLREKKTEALLIFVRTTLEDTFRESDLLNVEYLNCQKENLDFIEMKLKTLLDYLQQNVNNANSFISISKKIKQDHKAFYLLKQQEATFTYYRSLVNGLEYHLHKQDKWIPELVVIALLSEWILEEEKSIKSYPFLNNFDFVFLLEKYEELRKLSTNEEKEMIMKMFKLSSDLISRLKKSTIKKNKKVQPKRR